MQMVAAEKNQFRCHYAATQIVFGSYSPSEHVHENIRTVNSERTGGYAQYETGVSHKP